MTRFGEILTLWKIFISLWPCLEGLDLIGLSVYPALVISYAIAQINIVVNGQILNQQSSHLVTLVLIKIAPKWTILKYKNPRVIVCELFEALKSFHFVEVCEAYRLKPYSTVHLTPR